MRPLLLDPVVVAKPWGGRRLADFGVPLPGDGTYGEAWVVADLDPDTTSQPDPASRVRTGPHAGKRLEEVIADCQTELLGAVPSDGGRFPLLVKLLDARQPLSVQVHPPREVLASHPDARLKTESWLVLEADPGAELFLGLVDDARPDDVRRALGTPELVAMLRRVPARAGEVFHLPSGLVHALGAGIVVAELQTPSDTTWRLYDWQLELDRPARSLHLEAGWEAVEATWDMNTAPIPPRTSGPGTTRLLDAPDYVIDHHEVAAGASWPDGPLEGDGPRVVQVLEGGLQVDGTRAGRGQVVLLPAVTEAPLPVADSATRLLVTTPTGSGSGEGSTSA